MKRKIGFSLLAVFSFVIIFATTNSIDRLNKLVDLSAFLRNNTVSEFDYKNVTEGSISGMLRTLDPHSHYMNEIEYARMMEDQVGKFYGIGMVISERNGRVTVIAPIENTPASRMGIRSGDIIYEINGESTEGFSSNDAVEVLRGKKGTKVEITIKRPGMKQLLHFTVKRAEISEKTVDYYFMVDKDTAYLQIKSFGENTGTEVKEALSELKKEGMKKLVLDLRRNPGGLLNTAVEVSETFLKKGEKVVYIQGRDPRSRIDYFSEKTIGYENIPIVVLINRGSASGSEIVAGAIQDNDRGLVVGTTSWGKGLVQSVFELDKTKALALTTAKYYTPSGRCIQRDYSTSFADYFNPKDEEPKEHGKEFKTLLGRIIYSGGGIEPDKKVELGRLSPFLVKLRLTTSAFFRFAVKYTKDNNIISMNFKADEDILNKFEDFLKLEKISYTEKEITDNLKYIKATIEEEIVSIKFGLNEGRKRFLTIDEQFQKAMEYLPESEKMLKKSNKI